MVYAVRKIPVTVLAAISVAIISLSLIIFILMLDAVSGPVGWMGGHMMEGEQVSNTGLIVIFIAFLVMVISIAFIVFWILERKDTEKMAREKSARFLHFHRLEPTEAEVHVEKPVNEEPKNLSQDTHGISRILDGDERSMYQMIASSGGEILQRNLVEKKVFSKAKVTRLLDKLESRGLITRERFGSTNRIRLVK